ncbi:unnamed protein product [Candida verbasci]|uniref:STB6-like N-terminal domain-containing protein n=1 Tax=Candida verbasci TaxID=1227364 RepID=A0A9W4TWY6_9ASCO|nr:unnamed protein product [Candida verbasci]
MLSLGYQSGSSVNNLKHPNGINNNGYNNTHHDPTVKRDTLMNGTNSINNKNQFSNPNDFITYVIPDFNAVKYFQKEFVQSNEFHIIEESEVTGFEIYLVEQWMINRNISCVISAYTGNENSKISVVKFTIIKKPSKHYPLRFQEYLNEIIQNHSKIKKMETSRPPSMSTSRANSNNETITLAKLSSKAPTRRESTTNDSNEVCFVTNLTSLPSNLNLIPIPGGDVRAIEKYFIINSNLKRLQCTGRSMSLISDKLSDASEDKFRQMYRIYNTKIPVKFAIRELINIIQTSLFYFDLLDAKYCNGLLCAKTEEAIMNWWNLIGLPHYNIKPNFKNGALPSITVAAIISLILSVRLRIIIVGGTDVPKDPFDFENFMISIGQFQRQFKFEKTRKLDMETLNKLFTMTNARLLPQKDSNYFYSSPYGNNEIDQQDYDILGSPPTSRESNTSATSQKRSYGKKELKKLTNVVKTTVQDHINAASNRDMEDKSVPTGKATTGRIRNRIAKLADTISPLDVETLDLDVLVKNYLTGKKLLRLFYGVQNSGPFNLQSQISAEQPSPQREPGHHHTRRRGRSLSEDANAQQLYHFECLKDKIAQNQMLPISTDKHPLGFTKKFGRKSFVNHDQLSKKSLTHSLLEPGVNLGDETSIQSSTMVDSFLQLNNGDSNSFVESVNSNHGSISKKCESISGFQNPLAKFKHDLNRRNSWPILQNQHEQNLNILSLKKDTELLNKTAFEPPSVNLRSRSISFSCIENELLLKPDPKMGTIAKFSQIYLQNIRTLINYEYLRKYYHESNKKHDITTNVSVNKSFQSMNLELLKLKNLKNQMDSAKSKLIEGGMADEIEYNMRNLTSTIDRLSYETRIIVKRIKELEENFKLFEIKSNDDCQTRMNKMIDQVLQSNNFKQIYVDHEERNKIAFKLTGNENYYCNVKNDPEQMTILRWIIMYIYGFLSSIFHFFKFNRSNMNLDRIRHVWVKLDPNKSIIKRAYSYIGREPSKDSIAATDN